MRYILLDFVYNMCNGYNVYLVPLGRTVEFYQRNISWEKNQLLELKIVQQEFSEIYRPLQRLGIKS